jgi:hypothetical protein
MVPSEGRQAGAGKKDRGWGDCGTLGRGGEEKQNYMNNALSKDIKDKDTK